MHQALTPSQENYLEHILAMSSNGRTRVGDLAKSVGVKLPSVTRAVQKLAEAGMVRHQTYGTIEITDEGVDAAKSVIRRNDCLIRFLVETLKLPFEQGKEEACRIEHVISDDVLYRLELLVNYLSGSKEWGNRLKQELAEADGGNRDISRTTVGQMKPHA
jgi:DtxR family Mn-dependent transcriptional regulator